MLLALAAVRSGIKSAGLTVILTPGGPLSITGGHDKPPKASVEQTVNRKENVLSEEHAFKQKAPERIGHKATMN